MKYKIYTVCKEVKSIDEFYNSRTFKDGKQYRCKPCDKIARDSYEVRHKERRRDNLRKANRKHKYGVTDEQFKKMLHEQQNKCYICQTQMSEYYGNKPHDDQLCIDHDHQTGEVRGLLCHRCNRGLGMFKDNPSVLERASQYLRGLI